MIPMSAPTINRISAALKNLALAASNNTTVLQLLTAANLLLTALVTLLAMAIKKLADSLARNKGVVFPVAPPSTGGGVRNKQAFPGKLLLGSWLLGQPAAHK